MTPKLHTRDATTEPLDLFGQSLAQAPFAVWMADRDGRILAFNEAMRNLAEVEDPSRLLGSYNLFEDPHAKTQGLLPYIKRVLAGQVIETVVMMDFGHQAFYVRCQYFPLKDDRGDFAYVVQAVEDVTHEYLEDQDLSRAVQELETSGKEIALEEKEMAGLKARVRALKARLAGLKKDV